MGRIAFFLLLALVAWLVFRSFMRAQNRREEEVNARSPKGEDMVACARCGVNLPRSEARVEGETYVCRDNPRCIASP